MWIYVVSRGELVDPAGTTIGFGYSGDAEHYNNTASEAVPDVGPIPRGGWSIGEFFDDPGGKGPLVARLTPKLSTQTFGRSGFMIHGDTAAMDHTASHGCIILAHNLRQQIAASGDSDLEVV
jgi:hypothetical protein